MSASSDSLQARYAMKFASSSRMKPHWCASSCAIVHGTMKNGLSTLMFDSMVKGKNMPPMLA